MASIAKCLEDQNTNLNKWLDKLCLQTLICRKTRDFFKNCTIKKALFIYEKYINSEIWIQNAKENDENKKWMKNSYQSYRNVCKECKDKRILSFINMITSWELKHDLAEYQKGIKMKELKSNGCKLPNGYKLTWHIISDTKALPDENKKSKDWIKNPGEYTIDIGNTYIHDICTPHRECGEIIIGIYSPENYNFSGRIRNLHRITSFSNTATEFGFKYRGIYEV